MLAKIQQILNPANVSIIAGKLMGRVVREAPSDLVHGALLRLLD